MPALLSDLAPDARPIFVPRLLGQRPTLAALVAETISTWSYAEHAIGRSVAVMSRGINSAQMESYIENWRLPARLKIVRGIATAELEDPYKTTFLKVLDVISRLAARRHAFAHGIWGSVEALSDALLLVDPEHILRHWGAANDFLATFVADGPGAVNRFAPFDNRHVQVWSDTDLREEVTSMTKAYELALQLESLASDAPFGPTNVQRISAYNWLIQHPLVR